MTTPAELVLSKLEKFYEIQNNFDVLDLLLDKQRGRAQEMPSLRVLEHLVTTFSRQKGFEFKLPHRGRAHAPVRRLPGRAATSWQGPV